MPKNFTLNKLSTVFYIRFPLIQYPELEHKQDRPYVVIVVTIDGNRFALPLRTNIHHNYCYKFKKTGRTTNSVTGIDFTKAVIVNDPALIGDLTTIDNMEYVELANKFYFIYNKFKKYLSGYIHYRKNGGDEYTRRKYQYSTLQYFDKELGLV